VKDENGDLLADSHNILNRLKDYFSELLMYIGDYFSELLMYIGSVMLVINT
jgi:hypothetical protein